MVPCQKPFGTETGSLVRVTYTLHLLCVHCSPLTDPTLWFAIEIPPTRRKLPLLYAESELLTENPLLLHITGEQLQNDILSSPTKTVIKKLLKYLQGERGVQYELLHFCITVLIGLATTSEGSYWGGPSFQHHHQSEDTHFRSNMSLLAP